VLRNPRPGPARFDADLPVEEDWDMWLRLHRQHGMRFAHLSARTVVYHRPRGALSMTVQADAGTGGRLRGFADNHQYLMRRWPVAPGSRAERFRGHLMTAYRLGFAELAAGRPLAHFYYERVLRALYEAMTGKVDEIQLAQCLAEAVREESV